MEIKLNLTNGEQKDLVSYCNLNDVLISEVVKKSFITGFNIERYGLLNSNTPQEKIVEKEVEKIIEVIKEVEVEKIVEVIKEVVIEIPVEKVVVKEIVEVVVEREIPDNSLKPKLDALQTTLAKVRQETLEKDEKIKELENTIQELKKTQENRQAVYLKGSNLNNKL